MKLRQRHVALWATSLLAIAVSQPAVAQDRPSEDDLFGGASPSAPDHQEPSPAPGSEKPATENGSPGNAVAPPAPAASAAADRDAQVLGGSQTPMFSEEAAPADPLQIGGQLYLRTQSTALQGQAPGDWSFSTPSLLDVYFDARPNDRVRAYVLGRMSFDATLPSTPSSSDTPRTADATGSTDGSQSLDSLFAPQTRGPHVALDQLWLRFDIAHRVFVTAGKQHVRWGTGRFWAPTDYLHLRRRNPLDVFDARSGTTMLKLHVPVESKAWNFYGYALTENTDSTPTVERIAGAARAELVFGNAELGIGVFAQRQHKPKLGVDLSTGLGDFDLYGELALRDGSEIDRVQYAPGATVPELGEAPSWEPPAQTALRELQQVVDAYYRVMRLRQRLLRGQQHHHLPPFESRKLLDDCHRFEIAADPLEQADAELLMRHLATTEAQRDLGLVAFGQEARQVAKLDLVVAFVRARPELHFLDLDLLQLELRLVLLLRFPVLELAVIHDPADRGLGHRGDLDQVELGSFRLRNRIAQRHDSKLLAVHAHESNLGSIDFAVQSLLLLIKSYCGISITSKK